MYTQIYLGKTNLHLILCSSSTKLAQTPKILNCPQSYTSQAANDRKYVFHFRPKPKPKPEKHLALGRIPKPKPKVQISVKIGGILVKFNVSNDLSN